MECLQCKKPVRWYHRKKKGPIYKGKRLYVFHRTCKKVWRESISEQIEIEETFDEANVGFTHLGERF
ncbi:hypothetical protein LCGC14_2071550 [marine sediment metagenome]|uniref:Uncharacterized protein n=1 Tax=marine sediment metagenome TaxID=412755 RepID=A0A0F9HFC0_9ZZZZ